MAYLVINSFRTVQVLSNTTVLDAEYVVAQTQPHGFGFAYAVPLTSWLSGAGEGLLAVIADELELLASNGQAVGSVPVQDVDNNGLLTDAVDVTVAFNRDAQGLPPLYGSVVIPIQAFFGQNTGIGGLHVGESPNQYVVDEYNRLAALAAA